MRFPRTRFVDENTAFEQGIRVHDEVYEALDELTRPNVDYLAAAVETWDVIHAAETQLRIFAESHGIDIEAARVVVIEKNTARGYYK